MKSPALLFGTLLFAPCLALAQDLDEVDDAPGRRGPQIEQNVREINRGTFTKANMGGALYVGPRSTYIRPGSYLALGVGQDFIDQERNSMSWEIHFANGIHNGTSAEEQAIEQCYLNNTCTQGDLRTYTIGALLEYSIYPFRRLGVGLRAGGGLMFSPLLIESNAWDDIVVNEFAGNDPGIHSTPHPVVMGGPTFEYYTKLAHFSVGVDADFIYALNFDFGAQISGALKYTF
ncbi:MAG: adventurous gliding motility protein CglE [Myxococcota bacterium]